MQSSQPPETYPLTLQLNEEESIIESLDNMCDDVDG